MSVNNLQKASLAAAAGTAGTSGAVRENPAPSEVERAVDALIAKIKDTNDKVRTEAWLGAGQASAPAVKPLARVMTDEELEVARAAKHGLWKIVRHSGRPGADDEKKAVVAELMGLLGNDQPTPVQREVLWMLSEIGTEEPIKPIAALLSNKELQEDTRMVLQRIPGRKSIAALEAGLKAAPEDFKLNIAQSLRQRGAKVRGLACVKLVPTKKTDVKPLQ